MALWTVFEMACFFVTLDGNVPCDHTLQVPAVHSDDSGCASPSVHRQSWTLQLCHRDRCAQCILCRKVEIPRRSSWMLVAVLIVVRQVRLGPDSAEKCLEVPQLQSIVVLVQFLGKVVVGRSWC